MDDRVLGERGADMRYLGPVRLRYGLLGTTTLVLLAWVWAGCGLTSSTTSTSTPTNTSSDLSLASSSGAGCPSDQPRPVEVKGFFAPDVRVCFSNDATSAFITNVSDLVLTASYTGAGPVRMSGHQTSLHGFGDVAAATAVSGSYLGGGSYTLPSNSTLLVISDGVPVGVNFQVDATATAVANVARAVGAWVQSKVTSPGQALVGLVQSCASGATRVSHPDQLLSDTIRETLSLKACMDVIRQVKAGTEHSEEVAAAEQRNGAVEVLGLAKKLAGGSFDDELAGTIDVVAHALTAHR